MNQKINASAVGVDSPSNESKGISRHTLNILMMTDMNFVESSNKECPVVKGWRSSPLKSELFYHQLITRAKSLMKRTEDERRI